MKTRLFFSIILLPTVIIAQNPLSNPDSAKYLITSETPEIYFTIGVTSENEFRLSASEFQQLFVACGFGENDISSYHVIDLTDFRKMPEFSLYFKPSNFFSTTNQFLQRFSLLTAITFKPALFSGILEKSESFNFDTLVSAQTGQVFYLLDSLFVNSYEIQYQLQQIGLSTGIIYRSGLFYLSTGMSAFTSVRTATSVDHNTTAGIITIDNTGLSGYNYDPESTHTSQTNTNRNPFGYGIFFQLGASSDFYLNAWEHFALHFDVHHQPCWNFVAIPGFKTIHNFNFIVAIGCGLKFR